MNDSDVEGFMQALDALSAYYQKEPLPEMAAKIYFRGLAGYSLEQVSFAINKHIQDSEAGSFYPKVADLVKHLEGGSLTADQIISMARLKKNPLGILCRIHIGHWDLEHQTDMFYLKQRAEECLQMLPEWKAKASRGDFSDHQLAIMVKHGVNPCAPLYEGLAAPANQQEIALRIEHLKGSEFGRRMLELPPADDGGDGHIQAADNVAAFIASEMEKDD